MLESIAEAAGGRLSAGAQLRDRPRRRAPSRVSAAASCSTAALHELRRPLQALALEGERRAPTGRDHLDAGARRARRRRPRGQRRPRGRAPALVDARALAADAVATLARPGGARGPFDRARLARGRLAADLRRGGDRPGARQPDRERARARPRPDPARGHRAGRTPAAQRRRRRRRRGGGRPEPPTASSIAIRPGSGAATACGSSPRSPPTTAGGSRPARTSTAPARCSSCRSPSRRRP